MEREWEKAGEESVAIFFVFMEHMKSVLFLLII